MLEYNTEDILCKVVRLPTSASLESFVVSPFKKTMSFQFFTYTFVYYEKKVKFDIKKAEIDFKIAVVNSTFRSIFKPS
jgi:hypothetical protein